MLRSLTNVLHAITNTRSMKRSVPALVLVLALFAGVAVAVPAQATQEAAPGTWSRLADFSAQLWARVLAAVGFGAEVAPGEEGWVAVSEGAGPSISIGGFADAGPSIDINGLGAGDRSGGLRSVSAAAGPRISIDGFTENGEEGALTFAATDDPLNPQDPPTEAGPRIDIDG